MKYYFDLARSSLDTLGPRHVIALALILLVGSIIRRRYFSPLSHIPGPFLASITRLHHAFHIFRGKQSAWILKLHDKHGPFVRIAPNDVSVSHHEAPKKLLLTMLDKGPFYHTGAIPDWRFQNAFTIRDAKHKTRLSRTVAPAFAATTLLKSEAHMDAVISKLFGWMDKFSADKKPMDLDLYFAYMSVDMVGELFFSRQFGYLDQGKDIKGSIAASKSLEGLATMVGYFHWLYFLIVNPFTTWLGVLPTGYVYDNVAEAVTKRLKNPDARFDGLALWLKTHQDSPERLSLRELYATSTLVVQAGAGTVSAALQSFLYHTIRHPIAWQRMREELAKEQVEGRCQDSVVSHEDTNNLPYLQACIKEAFRFFGPLGMGLQRVVPEQGLVIGDCKFAPGTVLSIHATSLHVDKTIWGPDAREFNPDRWFAEDIAQKEKCFIPFSQGYCACPGQNLAKIEIAKICATIIRDYDVRQVDPGQEWKYEVYFSVCPYDWPVYIEKRQIQ